mgnify:FL=1
MIARFFIFFLRLPFIQRRIYNYYIKYVDKNKGKDLPDLRFLHRNSYHICGILYTEAKLAGGTTDDRLHYILKEFRDDKEINDMYNKRIVK